MKYISAGFLFISLPMAVQAIEADFSVSAGVALALEESADVQKAQVFGKPQVVLNGEGWTAEAKAFATFNSDDNLLPDSVNSGGYSSAGKPIKLNDDSYVEISELWARFEVSTDATVKVGKQVNNWGTLDEFRVLDVLNPQQFREFVFEDLSRTRLGLWGIDAQVRVGGGLLETFYSPDQTVHESPRPGDLFEFKSPRLRFGFPFSAASNIPVQLVEPDLDTYAIRYKGVVESVDFSVVAFNGPDYNPVGRLDILAGPRPALVLNRSHEKKALYGASAGTSIGPVIARVEYGFSPDRSFNTLQPGQQIPRLEVREIDQHLLAIGLDRQFNGNLLVTFQWLVDKLSDKPEGLIRQQVEHLVSVGFRKPLMNEKLAVRGRLVSTESGKDGLLQLGGDYAIDDSNSLRVGTDIAFGPDTGIFGQFEDRSRLKFEYEHFFD